MKKIMFVLVIIISFSFVASAKDPSWITPDVTSTTNDSQPTVKKQVRKTVKKRRLVRRKKVQKTQTRSLNKALPKVNKKTNKTLTRKKAVVPEQKALTITIHSMFANKYVIQSGLISYGKPVIQSDVLVSFKNGFYLDVWNSTQLKKKSISKNDVGSSEAEANPGYETDYNVGWSGPLVIGTNLDIGVSYCDLLKYWGIGASEDSVYNYIKLSHSVVAGFNVQIMGERYSMMKNSLYRGGNLYSAGVTRSDVWGGGSLTLDTSLESVHDTGTYGYKPGDVLRGKVGLSAKVFKSLTIILQVNRYEPLSVREDYTSTTATSGGLSYQF
jgi:hypothetical protein